MADNSSVIADRQHWTKRALCVGHPERGCWFSDDKDDASRAIAICRACPVRIECLTFAVDTRQSHGVWGGTTPYQRRRMRQRQVG